jgi:pimeloyl-ACP methyl ester carboxylesterase
MPKIKVNDVNLYYETYGKGKPLIFVSGFCGDHSMWQIITDAYVKNNFQVILFDNRGVGRSDCPNYPYSIEIMTKDVIALCDALNIKSANFIGNSMGGRIVQQIVYQYPDYVTAAVISNSYNKISMRTALYIKMQLEFFSNGMINSKASIASNLGFLYSDKFLRQPGALEKFTQLVAENPYPMSEIGFRCQLEALINDIDTSDFIKQIKKPCLVLGGDDDGITPQWQAAYLAQAIPNAEYYCFADSGHIPHVEHPELYNKIVLKFLQQHN